MSIASLWPASGIKTTSGSDSSNSTQTGDSSLFTTLLKKASAAEAESSATPTPEPVAASSSARLSRQLNLATSVSQQSNQPVNLGTLQTEAESALGQWQSDLLGKLSEQGITLEEPLRLLVRPGDGKIVVQGDHPRKADIEAILNEDQPLADSIRGISSLFDLLRAANQNHEFANAYEEDPLAAVQQFPHLFDEQTDWPLEFRIDQYGGQLIGE